MFPKSFFISYGNRWRLSENNSWSSQRIKFTWYYSFFIYFNLPEGQVMNVHFYLTWFIYWNYFWKRFIFNTFKDDVSWVSMGNFELLQPTDLFPDESVNQNFSSSHSLPFWADIPPYYMRPSVRYNFLTYKHWHIHHSS